MFCRFLYRTVIFLSALVFFLSCNHSSEKKTEQGKSATIEYARGFSIEYFDNYTLVKVINPWDTTQLLQQYILVDKNVPLEKQKLPQGTIVKVPVSDIACLYSIDACMIESLGDIDKVKAMAETRYVKHPMLRKGLDDKKIIDIGEATSLNIERLMEINPDIVITSPFQNTGYGKLSTTGIAIVENASYMENSPLGRAEWIRFIAAFLKKDKEAEQIIKEMAGRYFELKNKTANITQRPTLFSEKKFGQVWYIPGGDSYMAHFYKDSGANYLWEGEDDKATGSLTLNFEQVYEKAEKADYWIIKSDKPTNYNDLKAEFEPYSYFKAWKDRKIIFCDTKENNYYEEGIMNPDLILADLIHIFHPDSLPGHTNRYFELLNEK